MRSHVGTALAIAALTLLGGCNLLKGGGSEIAQCEAFVRGQLKAPSTYKRVHALASDSSLLTAREFQERLGDPVPPPESRLRLRDVSLTYEAQNGFGVPIEQTAYCQFKITEEDRESELISPLAVSREIEEKVARESAQEEPDYLEEESLFGNKPVSLRPPCCLPAPGR